MPMPEYPMDDDKLLGGLTMDKATELLSKQDPNQKFRCIKCGGHEVVAVFDLPMHLVNVHGENMVNLTNIEYVTKKYGEYFVPAG